MSKPSCYKIKLNKKILVQAGRPFLSTGKFLTIKKVLQEPTESFSDKMLTTEWNHLRGHTKYKKYNICWIESRVYSFMQPFI